MGQYALLSRFNNYDQFFLKFQRNNVTAGVAIRFPFFNPVQRAAAEVAKADANKSRKEAQNVKDQVSTETLKLQRSVSNCRRRVKWRNWNTSWRSQILNPRMQKSRAGRPASKMKRTPA